MNCSLQKLTSYMEYKNFKQLKKNFPDANKFNLLIRKGVFPYDYVNCWERFDEQTLPQKDDFFSFLNNEEITEEDYEHAQKVWREFEIKTLGEYTDLYLKTDVLLLSDIFECFRDTCLKSYDLDPVHYFTTPGFAWDCSLKISKVKLELLTDIDMILFFEKSIRVGVNQCSNRYSLANNHYMTNYDNTKPEKYLMYFDVGKFLILIIIHHLVIYNYFFF